MSFSVSRFKSFRDRTRNKTVSGWSRTGGQCVDAIRRYLKDVLGCTSNTFDWIAPGNAVDFFGNASSAHFKKVKNTPSGVPPEGAIVVVQHSSRGSDGKMHPYGHVFIAMKGCDVHTLRGYGQNWTLYRRCYEEAHRGYSEPNFKVIGWLIPK